MRAVQIFLAALLAGGLIPACGDDGATGVDAAVVIDAVGAIDAPSLPPGCDYVEQRDLTNDDVSAGGGTPEQTGLTFATRTTLCGVLDAGHFDGDITADVDGYVVTVATAADVLVRLHGAGVATPEFVGVDVYTGPNLDLLVGTLTVYGSHGVTAVHLPAGTYELVAFALSSDAIPASIPYRLELVADAPDARCAELTVGGYAEAGDGATSDGNDVVRLPVGSPPALTSSPADQPEPTLLTIDASSYRLTGSSADVVVADNYEDVDSFAISTGASTNELTVVLTWPGTTTNLDFLMFEAGDLQPLLRANTTATQAPERRTFSIKPSTAYWVLVGARAGTSGLPASYAATLCGAAFTP